MCTSLIKHFPLSREVFFFEKETIKTQRAWRTKPFFWYRIEKPGCRHPWAGRQCCFFCYVWGGNSGGKGPGCRWQLCQPSFIKSSIFCGITFCSAHYKLPRVSASVTLPGLTLLGCKYLVPAAPADRPVHRSCETGWLVLCPLRTVLAKTLQWGLTTAIALVGCVL